MDMPIYPTRIYVAIDKFFLAAYICLRTHLDTPLPSKLPNLSPIIYLIEKDARYICKH